MSEAATAYHTTHTATGRGDEYHTVTLPLPAHLVEQAEAECAAQSAALGDDAPGIGLADLVTACLWWALNGRCGCGRERLDRDDAARPTAWGRAREVTCG